LGSTTKRGWTKGAGYEFAFSPSWSAKFEYGYYNFGTVDIILSGGGNSFDYDIKQRIHTIKFGINYRFATGKSAGPVMANY
jgi:outer membrane immunogenic protein